LSFEYIFLEKRMVRIIKNIVRTCNNIPTIMFDDRRLNINTGIIINNICLK